MEKGNEILELGYQFAIKIVQYTAKSWEKAANMLLADSS